MKQQPDSKSQIRRSVRRQRAALSAATRQQASRELARQARGLPALFQARRLLSYAPTGGEIDPAMLESQLAATIYLPRINNFRNATMQFFPRSQNTRLNRYAIEEPQGSEGGLPVTQLDAVLMPLVSFARDGARLGMGAGFYDRALAHRLRANSLVRPFLVGISYAFQESESLPQEAWDVRLDAIITDRELIMVGRN